MLQDILYVTFIVGSKEKIFRLKLNSFSKLEAGGNHLGNLFDVDVSSNAFKEFYQYIRDKYGVLYEDREILATDSLIPEKAVIEQKGSMDVNEIQAHYPWKHLLVVTQGYEMERILFHPSVCGFEDELEE